MGHCFEGRVGGDVRVVGVHGRDGQVHGRWGDGRWGDGRWNDGRWIDGRGRWIDGRVRWGDGRWIDGRSLDDLTWRGLVSIVPPRFGPVTNEGRRIMGEVIV